MREIFLVWSFSGWEGRKEVLVKSYDHYPTQKELGECMRGSYGSNYLRVEKVYGIPVEKEPA